MKKGLLVLSVAVVALLLGCIGQAPVESNKTTGAGNVSAPVIKGTLQFIVSTPDGTPVSGAHVTILGEGKAIFDDNVFETRYVRDVPASEKPYSIEYSCPEGYSGSGTKEIMISDTSVQQVQIICEPVNISAKMSLTVRVVDQTGKTFENGTFSVKDKNGEVVYSSKTGVVTVPNLPEENAPYKISLDCGENRKDVGTTQDISFDPFGKSVEVKCIPFIPINIIGNKSLIPEWALVEIILTARPEKRVEGNFTYKATASVNKSVYEYVNSTESKTAKLKIIPSDYTWPHLKYELGLYCGRRYNVTLYDTYLYGGEKIQLNCSLYKQPLKIQFKVKGTNNKLEDWVIYFDHSEDGKKTYKYDPPWYSSYYTTNMTIGSALVYGYGTYGENKYYCQMWNTSLTSTVSKPSPNPIIFDCVPSDKVTYTVHATGLEGDPLENVKVTAQTLSGSKTVKYTNASGEAELSLSPSAYYYTKIWATCGEENSTSVYSGGVGAGQQVLPSSMNFPFKYYVIRCP